MWLEWESLDSKILLPWSQSLWDHGAFEIQFCKISLISDRRVLGHAPI